MGARKIRIQRFTADELRAMPPRVLQTLQSVLARRRLDLIGIRWHSHLYISWPPRGDLVIYYA